MVGVPGRSKGCITCRKRKKGCDKNVPACHQCIRSGLTCGGYGRDLIWVNTTPDGDNAGKALPHMPRDRGATSHRMPWNAIYTTRAGNNSDTDIALHPSLVRSSREELYFGMFVSTAMPYGHMLSPRASEMSNQGWMSSVDDFYKTENTLRFASMAMSAAILGAESKNSQLAFQSLEAYNRSVREMVKALKDPRRARSDSIIAAARVMQTYELFFGKAPDWRAHVEGQISLFQHRGPEAFTSGQAHQLYVDGRILIVMLSIGRRVRSPLHTPEWRTVPWRETPKSLKDKLIDILEDVPFMLIKYDTLKACEDIDQVDELRQSVFLNCREIDAALTEWELGSGLDLEKFDYTIAGTPLPMPQNDTEFALLYISSVYWGARLVLYTTLGLTLSYVFAGSSPRSDSDESAATPSSQATVSTPGTSPATSPGKSPGPPPVSNLGVTFVSPKVYVSKISNLVHLFFEPSAGALHSAAGLFPLALAVRFFAATEAPGTRSEDSQLIYNLYNKPFMGTHVGRFLTELQGDPQTVEEKSESESKAQENIWWYEVLGREKIRRSST